MLTLLVGSGDVAEKPHEDAIAAAVSSVDYFPAAHPLLGGIGPLLIQCLQSETVH